MVQIIKCLICGVVYNNYKCYLVHARIHRHEKVFPCPFFECGKNFGSFASFRKHIRFCHADPHDEPTKSARSFKCSLPTCNFAGCDFTKMMKHASSHISAGQPVFCHLQCPTRKPFATTNSLGIHKMYARRRGFQKIDFHSRPEEEQDCAGKRDYGGIVLDWDCGVCVEELGNSYDGESIRNDNSSKLSIVEKIFGCLFLNLLSKHHVPNSAIQVIVEALGEVARIQKEYVKEKGEDQAKKMNLSDVSTFHMIDQWCDGLLMTKVFGSNGIFRTAHMVHIWLIILLIS